MKHLQKEEAKITATDSYKDRASIGPDSSLLIRQAVLDDQRLFTCMVVSMSNVNEYPVEVEVHSEYTFLNKIIRMIVIVNLALALYCRTHCRTVEHVMHYRMYTAHSRLVADTLIPSQV